MHFTITTRGRFRAVQYATAELALAAEQANPSRLCAVSLNGGTVVVNGFYHETGTLSLTVDSGFSSLGILKIARGAIVAAHATYEG